MGYYINPENMSKEEFLYQFGSVIDPNDEFDFTGNELPVCLVDNYEFTAAGICYDQREFESFKRPDHRPKKWFAVSKADLKPYCSRL